MTQIKQNAEKEKRVDGDVFRALSSIYTGVFLINLKDDKYEIIHSTERIKKLLEGITSSQEAINYAIQRTVCKEDIIDMLTFVNLLTLSERMKSENSLDIEYRGNISGWNRGNFIAVERDSDNKLTRVLYTYQITDKEKQKAMEELEKLKKTEEENKEERQILENDKKELADELKYHNDFNQIVLEQMECGVLAYSIPGHKLLQINREALRIYGWKDEKEAAENLDKELSHVRLLHQEDASKLFKLREYNGSVKYQFIVTERQGKEKRVLAESKSLSGRYGGKVILTTFVDITHVVSLENEKAMLADKNILLANEKATLVDKNILLTNEKATLVDKNILLTNEKATLTDKNTLLTNEKATLTDKNTLLANEKAMLTDKNIFLTNENEELQRARDAVYSILNSGSYLCTYAEDGETLLHIKYSDAVRKLYGYTDEQDAPDTWDFWVNSAHPDDREYVMNNYLAALRDRTGNTSYSVTYRAVKKDGTIRWHRAAGYITRRKDGTAEFCYGFIMDVDEQKKASDLVKEALKKAELANEAKTSFLARMSHDIRTPMNGIIGLIDINEKHADDIAFTEQNRKKAKVAAEHLLALINDVLQLSKLEDSDVELSEMPFNMPDLLDDIYTITEMRTKENGITISREIDSNVQKYAYLWGSPLHIRQIYINLLGNSIKYNKQNGSIISTVSAEKIDAEHILSRVVIRDTGIGMSEEFLQHLFTPFSREHEEMTGQHEGTGLGLSIAKQLVEKMGGTIQVESEVNVGSCFTVEIPFRIATEADVKKPEELVETRNIKGRNILLVEDNELNMDISEIILTDAGANVTKAMNGHQAVKIFQKNKPGTFDVILMDVMMPIMNGYEATKYIRSMKRPDAKEIPIIAMTANAFVEDVEKAKQAGMNAHMSKPLDMQKMLTIISKYIND